MADAKISALTSKPVILLTDYVVLVDNTAIPIETKKCTVAQFLLSLNLKTGYEDNQTVTIAGWTVVFPAALGTDVNGEDYNLIITCVDAPESTGVVGYVITNRTQNGFTITPGIGAWIEYTALLK